MTIKISKTTVMIIILVIIFVAFIFSSDITKIQDNLAKMNPYYLVIGIALWSLGNFVRIVRWHLFLKGIDDKVPFKANVLYYLAGFAFVLSPGRLGEIVRSPYIKRDYGISISKTASIVFVERFYDFLGIITILSIGLVLTDFDRTILLVPIAILVVIVVIFKNKKLLSNLIGKLSKIRFLKNINSNFEESYTTGEKLIKPKFFTLGIVISTITYLLQALAVYLFILALNGKIVIEEILVIFPTSMFIAALSLIPGGVGIFDGGMVGLLVHYNLQYEIAITTTVLIRIIGIGLFSAIGLMCLNIISKK